jgi:hypothetical protein
MKKYADKNRSFREFAVNDLVFIKLQPYIQTSIAPRANHKLLFKFYGPFRVLKRISEVAYELQLHEGTTVHPVFHVSRLRQALTSGMTASPTLPEMTDVFSFPVKVLATRWRKKANKTVVQNLIQWSSGDTASATWEDRDELRSRFPAAPTWGQAVIQGGRDVRSPIVDATPTQDQEEAAHDFVPERPRRAAQPNPKYTGSEWTK